MAAKRRLYHWKCTMWGTLAFLFIYQICMAESRGIFQTRMISIANPRNTLKSGQCCGNLSPGVGCSKECITYTSVCLAFTESSIASCDLGRNNSAVLGGSIVTSNETITNRLIEVPFSFSWPGRFTIRLKAMDQGTVASTSEVNLIDDVTVSNTISPNTTWIYKNYTGSVASIHFKYRVICAKNYHGSRCNTVCKPRDDNFGHYRCDEQGTKVCLGGWTDVKSYCTTPLCRPACDHGTCRSPNDCSCDIGWTGATCSSCIKRPGCVNGLCVRPFECLCRTGWGGSLCDKETNYCGMHSPCANNATCHNDGLGRYRCDCPAGFTGMNCETELIPCSSYPCQNGGVCQENSTSFTCLCKNRFTGKLCDSRIDICSSVVCQNNGTCLDVNGTATCKCSPGFFGHQCESMATSSTGILTIISSTVVKISPSSSSLYILHSSIPQSRENTVQPSSKLTFPRYISISSGTKSSIPTYLYFSSSFGDLNTKELRSFTSLTPSMPQMVSPAQDYQKETNSLTRSASSNSVIALKTSSVTVTSEYISKPTGTLSSHIPIQHTPRMASIIEVSSSVFTVKKYSASTTSVSTLRTQNVTFSSVFSTLHLRNVSSSLRLSSSAGEQKTFTSSSALPSEGSIHPLPATSPTPRTGIGEDDTKARMAVAFSATLSVIVLGVVLLLFLWRRAHKRRMSISITGAPPVSHSFNTPHGLFYLATNSNERLNIPDTSINGIVENNNKNDIESHCDEKKDDPNTISMFSNLAFLERDHGPCIVYENQGHIERTDIDCIQNGYASDGSRDSSSGYNSQNSSARSSANSNSKSRAPKSPLTPQDIYALATPNPRRNLLPPNFEALPNYVVCNEESL